MSSGWQACAPADLTPEKFESPDKHAELVALLSSYESFLANNARGDRSTVFEEALQHIDWCPIQPPDCWTTLPGVVWAPLERRLFDVLPGERVVPRTIALPGLAPPRRLEALPTDRTGARSRQLARVLDVDQKGFPQGRWRGRL